MTKFYPGTVIVLFLIMVCGTVKGQYNDYKSITSKIDALSKDYPSLCSARSIGKSAGGRDILVLTIGTGETGLKPGIAIVGGVDGSHILGRELALGFASSVLKDGSAPEIKALLEKVTFYIIPDASPDETSQYFSDLKYERPGNARQVDDDRDFDTDEDPFEDIDRDGIITHFRVEDPAGKYVKSEDDDRVMAEADLSKGQTGNYLLFTEGTDNDRDQLFNEDGQGGVSFNRNFTFNYEEFGRYAGMHPISEPETKAIADFLYDRFNVFAVFTFGPQDNLGQPFKYSDRPGNDRIITSIRKTDETINKLVSDRYHKITGFKGAPETRPSPGNFMEWVYYHYGRYSFSSPGWWFPAEKGKNHEAEFLKYAEKNKINDVFVPWKEIAHPDFPGKKAEAGGLKPFVLYNPPADSVSSIVEKHYEFLCAVAAMHPELEFLDVKVEEAGNGIYRISLKVNNKGIFATVAEIGDINSWTRVMRISLEPGKGQSIISGRKVQRIQRLQGDESAAFSWLINGKGSVRINAGAVNTGTISTTLELR